MKEFSYTIQDPLGIHARPAGMLAKAAKEFASTTITVEKDGKTVKASQLMKLMSLGVKAGNTVIVRAEGDDEEGAIAAMEQFFNTNL